MKAKLLISVATIMALGCSAASANSHHSHGQSSNYAAPDHPVPYSQLDSYVGGSRQSGATGQGMAINQGAMSQTGPGAGSGASTMAPTASDNGNAGNSDTAMGAGTDHSNPGNTNSGVGNQPSTPSGAVNPPSGMTAGAPK